MYRDLHKLIGVAVQSLTVNARLVPIRCSRPGEQGLEIHAQRTRVPFQATLEQILAEYSLGMSIRSSDVRIWDNRHRNLLEIWHRPAHVEKTDKDTVVDDL